MQNPKAGLIRIIRVLALALAAAFALGGRAWAQDQPPEALAQGEVTISCPSFGVGGFVRAGDWCGLRLLINDSGSRPREIVVRITLPRGDADADQPQYERSMTTNPGTPQPLWMYVRIPSRFSQSDSLNVAVYAAVEQGGGAERGSFGAGKVLGVARLTRLMFANRTDAVFGIAGRRMMGLHGYEGTEMQWLPAGHERARIARALDPDTLPDRWMGLASFDFIVWNEPSPALLGAERAAAIREWVQRGGHLVVVLPRVGQAWTDEANNPLFDIVPRVSVQRREGVDLKPYSALITRSTELTMPKAEVLQTFTPLPGAQPEEAVCILTGVPLGPSQGGEREWLAVRRVVGAGMVTLVGLDVSSGWMERNVLPDPELFWHRILGRRGEIVTGGAVSQLASRVRDPVTFDATIPTLINKTGQAAAGVLLGFVLFVAYWLVAGPAGFAVLKKVGWARHGWVAFVAAAGLFTAVAWGGATLIRPARVEARHLTIIDHVYGQTVDRTRTWLSLLVPEYGQATVIVGDQKERSRFHNALAPWEPFGDSGDGFPDARAYRIECKSPDQVTIPTRATVKQLQADWAGGPPWKMPRPLSPDPQSKDGAVRFAEEGAKCYLTGKLFHELPGELRDVVLLVNLGQKDIARSLAGPKSGGPLLSNVYAYKLDSWRPGEEHAIDLEGETPTGFKYAAGDYLKTIIPQGREEENAQLSEATLSRRLTALAFFPMFQPPDVRNGNWSQSEKGAQRRYTHGMDLGAWFTQPCLIIVGHIGATEDQPSPTPLFIGSPDRPLATAGRTVVRWIYPLGSRPPSLPAPGTPEPPAEPPAESP